MKTFRATSEGPSIQRTTRSVGEAFPRRAWERGWGDVASAGDSGRCRWILDRARERGGAVRYFALGVGFTLVVIAAVFGGLRIYGEWRIGRVELINEGEPVVVQVLADGSDTAMGEPFDLVSRAVLALPDGEYRVRVNGMGRVGRTYRFAVNRGETQSRPISLDEGRLLGGEPGLPDADEGREGHGQLPIRFCAEDACPSSFGRGGRI